MIMNKQGGKREGAGRKKLDYPFKVIQVRVPLDYEKQVKDFIKILRKQWLQDNQKDSLYGSMQYKRNKKQKNC